MIIIQKGGGNIFDDSDRSKLDGIEASADVTDATNVNSAGAVMESDYNAQSVLGAVADDTPTAITVGEQTVIGRITGGNVKALTQAELANLVNSEPGAIGDITPDVANFTTITLIERSADPDAPAEGKCIVWMSDGTGKGNAGDVMLAVTAGGVTKYASLFDHSSGADW